MHNATIPPTIKKHRYGGLLGAIWSEVNCRDGIVTMVFCGKRGKGKSYAMFEWARLLDRGENDICRLCPDDIFIDDRIFVEKLAKHQFPRGKVICLDDAGIKLHKLEYLTRMLRAVSKILQNIRYKHPIIMMSLPSFEQLVKDARTMSDMFIDMQGVDYPNKTSYGYIQSLKVSSYSGELFRYGVLQIEKRLSPKFNLPVNHNINKPFRFDRPPDDFVKNYEKFKKPELDRLNNQIFEEAYKKPKPKHPKLSLPQAVEYCHNKLDTFIVKGKVDPIQIMLEVDAEGNQMFGALKAGHIAKALQRYL